MARCDVEVVLEDEGPFRGGDEVRGLVGVTVDQDCRCDALRAILAWRTRGSGNTDVGRGVAETLAAGDWKAGERHVHPFALRLPNGPVSYQGKHVAVEWRVEGRVDVPWALDPKSEQVIAVAGYDAERPYEHGSALQTGAAAESSANAVRMVLTVMAAAFIAMPLAMMCMGLGMAAIVASQEGIAPAGVFGLAFACFPLFFVAAGAGLLYFAWRNVLAERRLGPVVVDLDPAASPGDAVAVTVTFAPRKTLALNGARLTLSGRERAVRGSGKHRHTHVHVLHDAHEVLSEKRSLPKGEAVSLSGTVRLPPDAAPSFAAHSNAVQWVARVALDIEGWPDWVRDHTLAVRPRPG